jgi:hypothetical protein
MILEFHVQSAIDGKTCMLTGIVMQSANRNVPAPTGNPSSQANNETTSKQDQAKVNVPPRGSSSDAIKRSTNPSPLSRPATMASEVAEDGSSNAQSAGNMESPAAKQLAAINKGRKAKSKTSRLRRAFSFGSAADFRDVETSDKTEPSRPTMPNKHVLRRRRRLRALDTASTAADSLVAQQTTFPSRRQHLLLPS